ncbi:MAG: hypothetical protein CK425_10570 [Parachlamydia sp.]|nr:MAG: hypothetical protein CK425_10570 [Parachlamydia sp.]
MVFIDGYIWYCICDEHYTEYPTWKPSPLFEVIDGRMSKYWVYACDKESYEAIWAYPEWANAPHYFHFLNDSEKDYVGHFKHYKKLVDEEFPYLSVEKKADAPWLICPLCIDIYAWELNSPDAMITCSNCKRVFHNPRYKQIDASQN